MIENPSLIQIKKSSSRNRPSKKQLENFKNIPTGFICDALSGYAALDTKIKPLHVPGKNVEHIVGPALTVFSEIPSLIAFFLNSIIQELNFSSELTLVKVINIKTNDEIIILIFLI